MREATNRVEHLFIVRMWREAGSARAAGWRGSVEHTETHERLYFSSLPALTEFIDRSLAVGAPLEGDASA